MDTEIEELKEELEEQRKIVEDTNRVVHKMRRAGRWAFLFRVMWWAFFLGVSGAAYYYYLQPYISQLESAYGGMQDFQQQAHDLFAQYLDFSTTTRR